MLDNRGSLATRPFATSPTPITKDTVFTDPKKHLKSFPTTTAPVLDMHNTWKLLLSATRMTFLRGNPVYGAPRMCFQWHWFDQISSSPNGRRPSILNIGCADDPAYFGDNAFHYDLDDWSKTHDWFQQGNAEDLPFADQSFELVIMGDIHEHMKNPLKGSLEAARVGSKYVIWSIFEELRLPSPGQHIKIGQELSDESSRRDGWADRFDAQEQISPDRVGYPDDEDTPHLSHINSFVDSDIDDLIEKVLEQDFRLLVAAKLREVPEELDTGGRHHDWWNWLVAFERVPSDLSKLTTQQKLTVEDMESVP